MSHFLHRLESVTSELGNSKTVACDLKKTFQIFSRNYNALKNQFSSALTVKRLRFFYRAFSVLNQEHRLSCMTKETFSCQLGILSGHVNYARFPLTPVVSKIFRI